MVSLIILYSDEAITETKGIINHLKYFIRPDGSLMTSPDIPPAEMLIKHLTGTFNTEQIVISINDLISNTSKEETYSYILTLYEKSTKSKLKIDEIDKWLEDNDNIYFILDSNENVYGFIRYKYFNRFLMDDTYRKYGKFVNTDHFVFIDNVCYSNESKGSALLSILNNTTFTGIDSITISTDEKVINFFTSLGYFKTINNVLVRLTNGN